MLENELRERMVETQVEARGIRDPRVLAALRAVPRHRFVRRRDASLAYEDRPLPIGEGQTISQPYIVALMAEAARLRPTDRVLEIGTGSGYGAAVLAELAAEVVTVERIAALASIAKSRLEALGYDNVEVRHENGSVGWPSGAPYDAIVCTAAAPEVPDPLVQQLQPDGGRLVIPVGTRQRQTLLRVVRQGAEAEVHDLGPVAFVPLVGEAAYAS